MPRLWLITAFSLVLFTPPGQCLLALDVFKIIKIAFSGLDEISVFLIRTLERPGSPTFYIENAGNKFLRQVDNINTLINNVDLRNRFENEEILKEIYSLKNRMMFDSRSALGTVVDIMQQVDDANDQLNEYFEKGIEKKNGTIGNITLERVTVEDFAKSVVSHDKFSINMASRAMHRQIVAKSDARDILSSKGALEELFDLLHGDNKIEDKKYAGDI